MKRMLLVGIIVGCGLSVIANAFYWHDFPSGLGGGLIVGFGGLMATVVFTEE